MHFALGWPGSNVSSLALALCGLAAVGLISVGILALVTPERLSRSYGVPVKDPSAFAFVRATGVRDLILGAIFASSVYLKDGTVLLILCVAGLILALADFLIAFTTAKRIHSEHGAHLGSAIGFVVLIVLLMRP